MWHTHIQTSLSSDHERPLQLDKEQWCLQPQEKNCKKTVQQLIIRTSIHFISKRLVQKNQIKYEEKLQEMEKTSQLLSVSGQDLYSHLYFLNVAIVIQNIFASSEKPSIISKSQYNLNLKYQSLRKNHQQDKLTNV